MSTVYLITGANRGLGRALVAAYLLRKGSTVIAAVRDPKASSSQSLHQLPKESSSHLVVVKIDSKSMTDPAGAVASLSSHRILAIDVVIANAGISTVFPTVAQADPEDMLDHFNVNVIGPVLLFQAVLPLLQKSKQTPKFITLSSSAGTITDMEQRNFPNAAYGTSKAALNYVTKKVYLENPDVIAFPIDPGWVQTDMGNGGAKLLGLESAEITVDTSVVGLVNVIDKADRESASGKFLDYKGRICSW